ncbi:MAG: thiamine diphosphokinase [Clostridia bacterium]|nr:thiamine diphosphokinase [Clostridia bacterium]
MGICYIIGASECDEIAPRPITGDFLIAADRGVLTAERLGITPDLLLGDFDSLGYLPSGENIKTYPVEKDDTDIGLAIRAGRARGYRDFYIYGALGGARPDHAFANYQLLAALAREGCRAVLFGRGQSVTARTHGVLSLSGSAGALFSVFAVSGDATVSIRGAKYPLERGVLSPEYPLGISNALDARTEIEVHTGCALIFFENGVEIS